MKLNAFIAHAGVCSRRKAVELIKAGSVKLNGQIYLNPAYDVLPTDKITLNDRLVRSEKKIYIILNKPKGLLVTVSDEHERATVMDLIEKDFKQRLYPVGRLDKDTTGVLLLTNDGQLANQVAHPRYGVQKTYHVTLDRDLTDQDVKRICSGVFLEDGKVVVDNLNFCSDKSKKVVRLVIHSGKNRVIRRLFAKLGYRVKALDRVGFAALSAKGLARGQWRSLTTKEIDLLTPAAKK